MSRLKLTLYLFLIIHAAPVHAEIKVFQIGFSKCATSTLAAFFNANNIPAIHHDFGNLALSIHENVQSNKKLLSQEYSKYLVFTDMDNSFNVPPINAAMLYFKQMDQQYPGSKFILNTRDKKKWLKSRAAHKINQSPLLELTAKNLQIPKDEVLRRWSEEWDQHHQAVLDYFKDRPRDLLVFNIETDNIDKLCNFFAGSYTLDPSLYQHLNATQHNPREEEKVEVLELLHKTYSLQGNANFVSYSKNTQALTLHIIYPELDALLEKIAAHSKQHQQLPLHLTAEMQQMHLHYLYRIKLWSSPQYDDQPIQQTGYLQGYLNGLAIGLNPGVGGMFTCLLGISETEFTTKCFYQLKLM